MSKKQVELGSFTAQEFESKFLELFEDLTENKTPVNEPVAIILGGQPGAGKTTLHQIFENQMPNIIKIVGDDFREYHPHFDKLNEKYADSVPYTAPFAGKMTEALIEELSGKKYNLIIEGTLRTTDVPLKTNAILKNKGYKTELSIIATPAEKSWQGTLDRYNKMLEKGMTPRATEKSHHDKVVNVLAENLDALYLSKEFDKITLYNRNKEKLYDSVDTPKISPKNLLQSILDEKTALKDFEIKRIFDTSEQVYKVSISKDNFCKGYEILHNKNNSSVAEIMQDFEISKELAHEILLVADELEVKHKSIENEPPILIDKTIEKDIEYDEEELEF
ncbi:toxin zeta [Clostridia bacterium]|nr:toxin zeta [Clostridia bacterium]